MATAAARKAVVFHQEGRPKCSPHCARLIHDEPFVFRVRSDRPSSYMYACESCLRKAQGRQQASAANHPHSKGCSRLPAEPVDFGYVNRSKRTPNDCNWDNFMKNKSRYAIPTPYWNCNLTSYEEDLETRPPFVNYGGRYNNKSSGEKRTYNSLAVHQLKHREADEERLKSNRREQRLRREAKIYFREMDRRRFQDDRRNSPTE